MPTSDFKSFFSLAFEDKRQPYDYQERLAAGPCESRLISVPTGLGKTAAVVFAWLYNRVHLQDPRWPRRLVYCLPMRTLVEQTRDEAEKWLKAHGLDISRYIRDDQDNDVQFFWRNVVDNGPSPDEKPPHRDELCRVSIGDAVKFFKTDKVHAWRWNPLTEAWERAKSARPGVVYLLDQKCGGYSDAFGWTGDAKDLPTLHPAGHGTHESYGRDPRSFARYWLEWQSHVDGVCAEMQHILSIRSLPDEKGDETQPDLLFARGIRDGETLPAIPGLTEHLTMLHLSLMQMGEGPRGPSWLARMSALRDELGPFRLAWLETLLRAADMRTSAAEAARLAPPV